MGASVLFRAPTTGYLSTYARTYYNYFQSTAVIGFGLRRRRNPGRASTPRATPFIIAAPYHRGRNIVESHARSLRRRGDSHVRHPRLPNPRVRMTLQLQ